MNLEQYNVTWCTPGKFKSGFPSPKHENVQISNFLLFYDQFPLQYVYKIAKTVTANSNILTYIDYISKKKLRKKTPRISLNSHKAICF